MADKIKYTVNRSMQDGSNTYERGDTRELTEIDAATLLASGALSLPGKPAADRDPAVVHTFGTSPAEDAVRYTTPTGDGVVAGVPAIEQARTTIAPSVKVADTRAVSPPARKSR